MKQKAEQHQSKHAPVAFDQLRENAACRGVIRLPFLGKALLMVALIYLVIQMKSSEIQPFIYFQF